MTFSGACQDAHVEFVEFQKIARLNRPCIITEKIDGTNAQVYITDDLSTILFGSRTRWLDEKNDNHGWFKWAEAHRDDLLKLGPGRHYGEWWGSGIQRNYGLREKRFSLFNTSKWNTETLPPNLHVVPVLYEGPFNTETINAVLGALRTSGSAAVPGYLKPEGLIVYHIHAHQYFKVTLDKDEVPKSLRS